MNRLPRNYCHFRIWRGLLLAAQRNERFDFWHSSLAVWTGMGAKLCEVASRRKSSNRNNQTRGVRLGRNTGANLRQCWRALLFLSKLTTRSQLLNSMAQGLSANVDSCSGDQDILCYIPGGSFPYSQNLTIGPFPDPLYNFTVRFSQIRFSNTLLSTLGLPSGLFP
jgi:hypothetical protein